MAILETYVQSLGGTSLSLLPEAKMRLIHPGGKKKHSEDLVEEFTKPFQRHTTLNLQHRNLLIFFLIKDVLPNIKKQIENNVLMCAGQVANQFFEELKTTILVLQIKSV